MTAAVFLVMLVLPAVSAEFWACFSKGEHINYCNPLVPDRTAPNSGYLLCMSEYKPSQDCYNQGNWLACNQLTPDCSNQPGGTPTLDSNPPIITLLSPSQDHVYSSRSILLDILLNEQSKITYLDNINGKGRWKNVCKNCLSYSKKRSFKEGLNDLTFRAIDNNNNPSFESVQFYIDSKKPRINKLEPRKGFASGFFEIQFTEANPESLILNYGNIFQGFNSHSVDIQSECIPNKKKQKCTTFVDISQYNGQNIEVWAVLTDMAQVQALSKTNFLKVDITPPIINSLTHIINKRKVEVTLDITEPNFDEAKYIVDQGSSRARWKRFCSRLRNNECTKKISLRSGFHNIDIQVFDEAGNSAGRSIQVNV